MSVVTTDVHPGSAPGPSQDQPLGGTTTTAETPEAAPLIASARSGAVIVGLLAASTAVTFGSLFFAG